MDESIHDQEARRRHWEQRESVPVSPPKPAVSEQRRWTLTGGVWDDNTYCVSVDMSTKPPAVQHGERIEVCPVSELDAALAAHEACPACGERYFRAGELQVTIDAQREVDALKEELAEHREAYRKTIEDECPSDERHCACVPFLRSEVKRISDECDEGRCPSAEHEQLVSLALKGELAAERAHADRLAEALAPLHKVSLVADALRSYAGYRQQKEGKWTEHDEWLVGRANAIAQALAAHDARRQPATKGGER